jgi:hypothetical protein
VLIGALAAFASFGSRSNLPTTSRDATIELLLKAFSIPLFWVIPVALTPALAADSFVGERLARFTASRERLMSRR